VLAFGAVACSAHARSTTDGGGGGDAADAFVMGNGQFGDSCEQHTDCASGYCVQPVGDIHGMCSRECNNDCPPGWNCLDVAFEHGHKMLCVPDAARQCQPCASDMECPGGACLSIDNSGRCEAACTSNTQCLAGYACKPDPTGNHAGMFCQPTIGTCTCSAANQGGVRTCQGLTNQFGTCLGTQTCDAATGWSACTARGASAETCNGIDDDCDGIVDENVPGVGAACTNSNAAGTCPGVTACNGAAGIQCAGQVPTQELCNGIDDNCNGQIDEGFANLNQSCFVGMGACQREGAFVCNTTHDGTVCNATPGVATPEKCNGIDDDCDGVIDNGFPQLGQQCSQGQGACQVFGTFACKADGTGVTCPVTPGTGTTETCNYIDDDCNGIVDDGFRNPATGLYSLDARNCGACGNDCTTQFPFVNASGACQVINNVAQCTEKCATNTFNLDGFTMDGCYFTLDGTGIYVAGDDPTAVDDANCGLGPTGTGGTNHPCLTITHGLARAQALGKKTVYVADATYTESVTLVSGISLLGGYHETSWIRHLASTDTTIDGVMSLGSHDITVNATNITAATTFEGFVVRGSENAKAGGNSYAIYVTGSNASLAIQNNQIFAGRGGPGAAGASGANGGAGAAGGPYLAATYDAFQVTGGVCPSSANRGAYGGGQTTCAGVAVNGGNGGGINCSPVQNTQNSTSIAPATGGSVGTGGSGGAAGTAGGRGYDATLVGNQCSVPFTGTPPNQTLLNPYGLNGNPGGVGGAAGGVTGCLAPIGFIQNGHWTAGAGPSGNIGSSGGGGGGGGAGGGAICQGCTVGNKDDMLGGHGGGGGAGGCGGNGGMGGGGGGGAFAIYIFGGAAPTIAGNSIELGAGGAGGTGGIGGAGGLGGSGSQGGLNTSFFCAGNAGRGGDGGNGGPGSGGGGGCGGAAFGIYTNSVGTPSYCGSNAMSGGTGGIAGSGGSSGGVSGGGGSPGVVLNCEST
jgi:hypothetical protein